MPHTGAGGSEGGTGRFLVGFLMLCIGGYLFLTQVKVSSGLSGGFGFGSQMYAGSMGGMQYSVTGGMIFVPFIFGIGMVFWNSKNILGWLLTLGSTAAFFFGIVVSVRMQLKPMTAFDLSVILILVAGGVGLLGSSLRKLDPKPSKYRGRL